MNSKGIDDQARRHKTMNTVSMIESKRRENDIERDTEPERGISDQNAMNSNWQEWIIDFWRNSLKGNRY